MAVKFITAKEAAGLIPDGATLGTNGFMGTAFPEEIVQEIETHFLETKRPRDLTLYFCAAQGDNKTKGLQHMAHEGLIRRTIGGHYGMARKIGEMVLNNTIEAYDLPQGVIAHLQCETAAHQPGVLTRVGLGTFVDPRLAGGKMNEKTKAAEDLVEVVNFHGEDLLFYKSIPVDCAVIAGTYADENGNISFEREGVRAESLALALACKNSGGKVFVQVQRVVKSGSLHPRCVEIPGVLVDYVVVASDMKYCMQNFGTPYNPGFSGEHRMGMAEFTPAPLNNKKVIGRRAAMELKEGVVVNLGVGIPEYISLVAAEEGISNEFTMTVEDGLFGGNPQSGLDFGVSLNPSCMVTMSSMFDFYDGGGLDQAFVGFAQGDMEGNVNVSKFGRLMPGCGGFIDITQNTKQVYYCGTFTAGGLETEIGGGEMHIVREGKVDKFIRNVDQITFSAKTAVRNNLPVMYITERAVFRLTRDGIMLCEAAPGIDIEKDIFAHMPAKPLVSPDFKRMDARIFRDEAMGLKSK
ncbi:MAG: acyl CoA:acetate/3-ketoacid CoA transferase [Oscillospiraceae bacterium]|jgi:propionate CoA-transferase|nr:acyl CoA:acetate/3-ketoacid CoA transferase [Oscillospiraceae bacterium]